MPLTFTFSCFTINGIFFLIDERQMDDNPDLPLNDLSSGGLKEPRPPEDDGAKYAPRSKRVIYYALVGNGAIMILKFIAAVISGSSAMLAESFHSLADTGNQSLLLLGVVLSKKPPDEKHPFGYGMDRYFWAFVVAVCMFTIGATFSVVEGIRKIRAPHPFEHFELTYLVLGFAFVFEFIAWRVAAKEFQKLRFGRSIWKTLQDTRDPAIITVLLEDSAAMIGILIAGIGIGASVYLDNYLYDGIASVIIGIMLGAVAIFLSMESHDFLLGESASRRDRAAIREIFNNFPEVERIIELLTMHISPDDILVNANIEFRDGLTTEQIEHLIDEIEAALSRRLPQVKKIFIEADSLKETHRVSYKSFVGP